MTRTNAFSLLCVVIRVCAIWLGARLVISMPGMAVQIKQASDAGIGAGPYWFLLSGVLLVGVASWLFAERIARLAMTRPQDHVFESDLDAQAWLGIALGAIGAWFLFNALVDGVGMAARMLYVARQRDLYPGTSIDDGHLFDWVPVVVQAMIGAGLLLRGSGIATLVHRLRYAGYKRGSSNE